MIIKKRNRLSLMAEDCVWRPVSRFCMFIHFPFPSLLNNADCDIGSHVYHDKASGTGNILRYFLLLLSYFVVVLL